MKTIYEAKKLVKDNLNNTVSIKVHGIRNKNDDIDGIISELYPNIFIVDTLKGKRCFSYKDVLIGQVILKIK